jgi:hypothetical protein
LPFPGHSGTLGHMSTPQDEPKSKTTDPEAEPEKPESAGRVLEPNTSVPQDKLPPNTSVPQDNN